MPKYSHGKKVNISLEKLNVDGVSLVGIDLVNYVNRHFVEAAALSTSGLSPTIFIYVFKLTCTFYLLFISNK